jgi:hypothetical protein
MKALRTTATVATATPLRNRRIDVRIADAMVCVLGRKAALDIRSLREPRVSIEPHIRLDDLDLWHR